MKKRNKNLEVNETFVEKVPSDDVGLHVGGPNFDADMNQTLIITMTKKRKTL